MHYNIQKLASDSKNIYAKGFSLLEVLVALFVLSWGLLGILSLQTVTIRRNYEAYLSSVATTQVASRINIMQSANNSQLLLMWQQDNAELLPQGEGEIKGNIIYVCWYSRLDDSKHCVTNVEV